MIKVWVLTVLFSHAGTGSSSSPTFAVTKYDYQTQQSCEVWREFWRKQWKVGNAVCSLEERAK